MIDHLVAIVKRVFLRTFLGRLIKADAFWNRNACALEKLRELRAFCGALSLDRKIGIHHPRNGHWPITYPLGARLLYFDKTRLYEALLLLNNLRLHALARKCSRHKDYTPVPETPESIAAVNIFLDVD